MDRLYTVRVTAAPPGHLANRPIDTKWYEVEAIDLKDALNRVLHGYQYREIFHLSVVRNSGELIKIPGFVPRDD